MDNTGEIIQTALLDLMKEKRFDEITIVEISERSKYNRTTIYRHYLNKMNILQAIEDDVLASLDGSDQDETGKSHVLQILEAVNKKRSIISILLSPNGDPTFHEHFVSFLTTKGLKTIENSCRFNSLDTRQKELLVQYISSALLGLVKYWLSHPEMSVEELDNFFERLFKRGISSFTAE